MAIIKTLAVFLALVAPRYVFSLQVSPNSPCSPLCIDRGDFDRSDPNSSNTNSADMTCKDAEYARTTTGVKWQKCMSCLQKSGFSQGGESDQGWFLYNLRYNFNYCMLGFPNNTLVGSNPCQTSRACGALKKALQDGNLDPKASTEYGYCAADGGAMTGEFYAKCLTCIGSFTDQVYVSNGLIALEAGCLQRPGPGKVLALSDTVFSRTPITITDPGTADGGGSTPGGSAAPQGGSITPTTTIAVAVISGLIVLAATAAIVFVCIRKRRNRRARLAGSWTNPNNNDNGGGSDNYGNHRPHSSLSFRCQTHISPTSPIKFFPGGGGGGGGGGEDYSPYDDDASPQRRHITSMRASQQQQQQGSLWRPSNAVSSLSPVAENQPQFPPLSEKASIGLHQLTTSLPVMPRSTHVSPIVTRMSPMSATPTSATQLLSSSSFEGGNGGNGAVAAYVPADYIGASPFRAPATAVAAAAAAADQSRQQHSPIAIAHHQPVSPQQQQQQQQQQWGWANSTPPPPPAKSPRLSVVAGRPFGAKKAAAAAAAAARESGSPVETRAIQTSFPAPPRR